MLRRSTKATHLLIALATTSVLALALLGEAPAARRPDHRAAAVLPLPDSVRFDAIYSGLGPEGVDLVWRGRTPAPLPGIATLRVWYAGTAPERTMPVWPVTALLFLSTDDYRTAFVAELSGSLNWRTGELRLAGLVTDGALAPAPVEHLVQLAWPGRDGAATLRFPTPPEMHP